MNHKLLTLSLLTLAPFLLNGQPAPPDAPDHPDGMQHRGPGEPGGPGGDHGQGGPGGPDRMGGPMAPEKLVEHLRDPEVKAELKVSDEQITRMDKAIYDMQKSLIDLDGDKRLLQLDMKRLLDADHFDAAGAQALADKLAAAESRVLRARFGGLIEVRRILTDDQFKALRALRKNRMQARPRAGGAQKGAPRGGQRRMRRGGGAAPMAPPPSEE